MNDTDIQATFDYGYDTSTQEDMTCIAPPRPATLPSQANVNANWLPPVGQQTTPSCFVWSSTYGIATFAAAQANNRSPASPDNQASPTYTYIKIQQQQGVSPNNCVGGQILWPLNFLKANGGTPSVATAPNEVHCTNSWTAYGTGTLAPDSTFAVSSWACIDLTGSGGLDDMRTIISSGVPLAYGTSLYTDFPTYDGSQVPYFGNGQPLYNTKTGKPAGHCMMIIGYDDMMGITPGGARGAVLIQNSFGTSWGTEWNGSRGYVWMAYTTLLALAQGTAFYITGMANGAQR
jgi:C1A family cysteine protease